MTQCEHGTAFDETCAKCAFELVAAKRAAALPDVSLEGFAVLGLRPHWLLQGEVLAFRLALEARRDSSDPQRSQPRPVVVVHERACTLTEWNRMPPERRRAWVRQVAVNALTHELDEWLSLDGQRSSPHDGR